MVEKEDDFNEAKVKILKNIKECITKINKKQFTLEELAFQMALSKNLEKYDKNIPQHVRAGIILKRRFPQRELKAGDIIRFIKTRSAEGVMPLELAKVQNISTTKYKEMLEKAFEQVLDVVGVDIRDLDGVKKRRIDDFIN
jgi:DNA polymerase I